MSADTPNDNNETLIQFVTRKDWGGASKAMHSLMITNATTASSSSSTCVNLQGVFHQAILSDDDSVPFSPFLQALIDADVDVSTPIEGGGYRQRDAVRPIHIAAKGGHLHTLKLLLANGADINAANVAKCTPLMHAIMYQQWEVVSYLVGNSEEVMGLDTGFSDYDGNTALHHLCTSSNFAALTSLRMLCRRDPSLVHIANVKGRLPVHYAVLSWGLSLCDMLHKEFNSPIDLPDKEGMTPFAEAVKGVQGVRSSSYLALTEWFISQGIDPNTGRMLADNNDSNDTAAPAAFQTEAAEPPLGQPPIFYATTTSALKIFLNHGVTITANHLRRLCSSTMTTLQMIQLFLDCGADLEGVLSEDGTSVLSAPEGIPSSAANTRNQDTTRQISSGRALASDSDVLSLLSAEGATTPFKGF